MSGKLDQALSEITDSTRRASAGRRKTQRRSAVRANAVIAPSAGVKKAVKPARKAGAKAVSIPTGPAAKGDSKVIVSNLPRDVTEHQIKEYFVQSVGSIKRVELVYGPNSQSRGIANVSFRDAAGASKAFQKLNGLLVDGRPIKIEMVVGAAQADKLAPASKTLAERTTQPKNQPKPKSAAVNKKGAGSKTGAKTGKKTAARSARPAKKTAAELDSEMADYFVSTTENTAAAAPAAAPAVGGEAMEEIM